MKKQKKKLVCSFINNRDKKDFVDYLNSNFDIPVEKIFVHNMKKNLSEKFITFMIENDKDYKFSGKFEDTKLIHIHTKGKCYFTINALNKLIEVTSDIEDKKDYIKKEIDFNLYNNKLILLRSNNLIIEEIEKI